MAACQHKVDINQAYHQQEVELVHLKIGEEYLAINLKIELAQLQLEAEKLGVKQVELGHTSLGSD
jgi:hypothetical protein